ncbi:envelope stress response membrane protein PspC [Catenovulum sp. 2E275]|uniref:envelope stress response membrane protein PspC n=1 Tax=Catenovulum sp. 2E275 TaxID=2980497 RepID=UPI0021CF3BB0|nr:envelope stress response membrane protein PspC [Catenovulum sp. 2E275]MCU4676733.1 envelope stress response membrane protein PspC [Catenovulum sp. 2E275]
MTNSNQTNKRLKRDTANARIAGVCAGVARHFSLETWVVRIIVFGSLFFAGGLTLFVYLAAWLILERDDKTSAYQQDINSTYSGETYHFDIKENTWRAGQPPKQALQTIAHAYQTLEQRIQQMEKHVTSERFKVEREINKL